MISRRVNSSVHGLLFAGLFLAAPAATAQGTAKPELDKIPKKVMNALKAKFPNPVIQKWTKEKEGDLVLFDIEFKQGDRHFEADIKDDGTFQNWEKEISVQDLPAAVRQGQGRGADQQTHPGAGDRPR